MLGWGGWGVSSLTFSVASVMGFRVTPIVFRY